jgi:hypothetical protein
MTDEEVLMKVKNSESELNTVAEIHKMLIESNMVCSIDTLRQKVNKLFCDGYLGNESTGDGVNMYYLIYFPEYEPHNSLE